EILLAKQVDGLIICPTPGNYDYYYHLKEANFPIVFIDRTPKDYIYPSIILDNIEASKLAVDIFMENNITELGIVLPQLIEGVIPRFERLEGFRQALNEYNLALKQEWVISGDVNEIYHNLQRLFVDCNFPKGFFTVNDISLIELLK